MPANAKIRFAVVGLGWFGQSAVLPAFKRLKRAELAAIVSGDAAKLAELADVHHVRRVARYEEYDALLRSGEIDAVFIALPNSMHADYAIRAAEAGIHVLCEKPMAVTEDDCVRMIEAAEAADVKLMIAYRLHFEAANLAVVDLVRSGKLGDLRYFSSAFSMSVQQGNSRLSAELGGGPLRDIGIYCINASRYLFQQEPLEVMAFADSRAGDVRFAGVHEQVAVMMRFPEQRLASFVIGFGTSDVSRFDIVGTQGSAHLDPAFSHASDLSLDLRLGGRRMRRKYRKRDQVAAELEYFAECVLEDHDPSPSGIEGLADIHIIQAIEESIERRQPVEIRPLPPHRRPDPRQERHVPPHDEPSLVHARPPR